MKHHLRFGIVVWLICGAFLFAQSKPSSSEQKQETPATTDQKQEHPPAVTPQQAFGNSGMTAAYGPMEILTDTRGVNFGPYLQRVRHDVKVNWYNQIPESARAPIMKKGKVVIEFSILKNGHVADMRLVSTSGDVTLDRGAWGSIAGGSIAGSNLFPPLPSEFDGPYLRLRFAFYYNPDKSPASESGVKVSITPHDDVTVPIGGSEVFFATVRGSTNLSVKWSITGEGCSGSACGTMSAGVYEAPSVLPSPPSVLLTATSEGDSTATASVSVQLVKPDSSR